MSLKLALRKRDVIKESIKKLSPTIDTHVKANNCDELFPLKEVIEEKYEQIKTHDKEILELMTDDDKFEEEEDLKTEFVIFYKKLLHSINSCIEKRDKKITSSVSSANSNPSQTAPKQNHVHLPEIYIQPFDGDPHNFLEFWDSFRYSIHENESISNVQKMSYLRSLLKGDAASCISGFNITDDNYKTAVKLLKERYDNK